MTDHKILVNIALFGPISLRLIDDISKAFLAYDPNVMLIDLNQPESTRIDATLCLTSIKSPSLSAPQNTAGAPSPDAIASNPGQAQNRQ